MRCQILTSGYQLVPMYPLHYHILPTGPAEIKHYSKIHRNIHCLKSLVFFYIDIVIELLFLESSTVVQMNR